jgi:hypothetical protein
MMGELMEKGDENTGISILSSSASTLHYGLLGFWILYIIYYPKQNTSKKLNLFLSSGKSLEGIAFAVYVRKNCQSLDNINQPTTSMQTARAKFH